MSARTLLVELFTEELPPKALRRLGEAFAEGIYRSLASGGYLAPVADSPRGHRSWTWFATPRRLAVSIPQVLDVAPDEPIVDKLMP
ncbi:MAG: glycine--tRNA ligase subunit beta, partial [Burkholderiales bacterium]|nr:glycine--tRNA ligase subunit beta [Burkholderiales bacterium]